MKVPVHNVSGEVVEHIQLREDVFGVPLNEAVVHQALVRQLANARHGTASTKTRAQVSGGGRKPFRQKGTGRARRGSSSSPLMRGGGVVFGPHPRSYRQAMPKKMRQLALRCVL
ncbi:50S ribosomal protein L4, partial [Chloroflexota bacterium]